MSALDRMGAAVARLEATQHHIDTERPQSMDQTAALAQILTELSDGNRADAAYALTSLAEAIAENRYGFMPDVAEALEIFTARMGTAS